MKLNATTILCGLLVYTCIGTHAQNDISGKLTTPTGEAPYNVETFDAYMQAADGSGSKHTVFFNADGSYSVFGIPNKIEDEDLLKQGHFIDDGVNSSANISGFLKPGLQEKDIQAQLFDVQGRALSVDEVSYDPTTSRVDVFADMRDKAPGMYIARVSAPGEAHTVKLMNNPSVGSVNQTVSDSRLETIAREANRLKGSTASTSTYNFVVDDPFDNLRDTTYTVTVNDNSASEFNGEIKHAKKGEFVFVVENDKNEGIGNLPVIFAYNQENIDPSKTDTVMVSGATGIGNASLDLDKVGYNPKVILEYVDGATKPFKPKTENITVTPGDNDYKIFNVESYLNQQIILQLVDLYDTTQVVNNMDVGVRYLDTDVVKYYNSDNEGKIFLDRKPENSDIAIQINGNNDYFSRTAITKTGGEKIGHMNYQLVTNENMEERTQKVIMVPKVLETGLEEQPTIEITSSEFIDAYRGVSLQVANGRLDIYVNPNIDLPDATINEYLDYFSERIGVPINRVYENKDPSSSEANEYDYYTNNFKEGDKVFTSTLARGSPETTYNYATLDGNVTIYSGNATSTGSKNTMYKELWRLYGFDQTPYGDASAEDGGLTINVKEGAVARALAKMYQYYAKGTDYTTPENVTNSQ